jgi:phosphate transport system substrate-binding protein
MNRSQLEAAGEPVIHVPLVIGAVVPLYNLPGVTQPLNFTGQVLADIYLGKITKWNDPALTELNPNANLPDLGIQPVFRSDSSGTSNVFTEYLSKVSPEFRSRIGASTSPAFPPGVGIGQPKTDGVAGFVDRTPGAIGYVEVTYALDKKAQFGAVQNKAGQFVRADLASITAAAASLTEPPTDEPYSLHELTYSLTDPAGENAYPIAAMSYAVLYARQANAAKGQALVSFLKWCVSPDAQRMAELRNYAPLPAELIARIHAKLDAVEVGK